MTQPSAPRLTILALAWTLPLAAAWGQTAPINDTGIEFCRNHTTGTDTAVTVTTTCADLPAEGAQDARYGRDAAAVKGALPTKVGGSAGTPSDQPNGFDYTKISNTGNPLPDTAALGSGPNAWACTRDNVTGLMWEVKVADPVNSSDPVHPRAMGNTYSWYFINAYGGAGTANGGSCPTTGYCDTEKFAADVNTAGLCGHKDWRVPTIAELSGLADLGRVGPAIDPTYFPNTPPASFFWSASPLASSSGGAWGVNFSYGNDGWDFRSNAYQVLLVRAGQ